MKIQIHRVSADGKASFVVRVGRTRKGSCVFEDGSAEERLLSLLCEAQGLDSPKLTKSKLARILVGLGAHERFEEPRRSTTIRRTQQLMRDLRLLGFPIISDKYGVWLANSTEELEEFCKWIRNKAAADYKAAKELDKALSQCLT